MTTMHHDGSNALTVQFAFAFLWFYSVLPCHLPSVRFFFYQRLQLCAHLMMSENHKRRQLGDTKKKEQRWLDGNGKGKKKIGSSSAINLISLLHTERASVHSRWTEAGRANDFVFLNYSKSQQDVVITFSRAWNRASNSTMPCEEFEFFSDRFSFLLFFVLFFGKEGRKKKSLNEGDFLSFGYSWENEIKMCWWISYDEGVYCLAKHHLFSPPPHIRFFFQFFFSCHWLLFIQMTTVRRGGRQEAVVIISTLFCRSKWVLSDFFFRFSISFWCPDVWSLCGDVIVK